MSKNFNNNSLIDSSLNLNVQNLTNNVALLPTQTSLNNAINTNNLLYTTTVGINTLLTNTVNGQVVLRDTAITNAITNNNLLYSLKDGRLEYSKQKASEKTTVRTITDATHRYFYPRVLFNHSFIKPGKCAFKINPAAWSSFTVISF